MSLHLSTESLLLMYLAGELPEEGRAHVERLLAKDPALRVQLDTLRDAYADVDEAIRAADLTERVATPASTAARRVGQQVRSRQAVALAEIPAEQPPRSLRLSGRAFLSAAAAVAAVVGCVLWYNARPPAGGGVAKQPPQLSPGITRTASGGFIYPLLGGGPFGTGGAVEDAAEWPDSEELADATETDSELALAEAEDELYALSEPLAEDDDVPTILLDGDTDER